MTIGLACLLFWLTLGIDFIYFQISQLELPTWFRLACTVAMVMLLVATAMTWVLARMLRRIRPADLALALERKFPELNDRLITAVEMEGGAGSPLQTTMLERTIDEAVSRLSAIRLQETINPVPLRRMLLACGVLLASVLALGISNAQAMERWYRAYILGRDDYWEPFRRNDLNVRIVAQPGDRLREFDARGVYRHPRGADLQLLALVPETAVPPDRVDLQFVAYGGAGQQRGRVTMSRMGDSEFRHTLSRVVDDHQLWLRGGDYVNRLPFRIQVVDPPQVDSLELSCEYPTYTGLEDRPIHVAGMQISLPLETKFDLAATVNKPLLSVRLRCRHFELTFGWEENEPGRAPLAPQLTILDPATGDQRRISSAAAAVPLWTETRRGFTVPFVITAQGAEQLANLQTAAFPLPLPPDETLQIILEDEDLIYSPEPATLTIHGIVDQPPVVDVRRTGIGPLVTRMANIPIEGKLTDDYGVQRGWFGYRVQHETQEHRQDLVRQPEGKKEFRLHQSDDVHVERFNLIPLKLEDGQSLTLTVYAQDGDDLNGPHIAHGEVFSFKIVSREELLAKLYDREVNLRLRFEQIRTEVGDLRKTLDATRAQVRDLETPSASNPPALDVVAAYVDRALHQIRKNQTESRSIEVSFRDLRDEMVNNRVDTVELLERIERRVIDRLELLNAADFLEVDRRLGTFRLAVERRSGMGAAADDVTPALDQLLAQMDAILAEMRDRGTFNDLIQNLQDIIKRQKQLQEQTEDKRIEESFFSPKK